MLQASKLIPQGRGLATALVRLESAAFNERQLWIVPGVSDTGSGVSSDAVPDVMRGEETQIAGALAANPDFDGAMCLPGTQTVLYAILRALAEAGDEILIGDPRRGREIQTMTDAEVPKCDIERSQMSVA